MGKRKIAYISKMSKVLGPWMSRRHDEISLGGETLAGAKTGPQSPLANYLSPFDEVLELVKRRAFYGGEHILLLWGSVVG